MGKRARGKIRNTVQVIKYSARARLSNVVFVIFHFLQFTLFFIGIQKFYNIQRFMQDNEVGVHNNRKSANLKKKIFCERFILTLFETNYYFLNNMLTSDRFFHIDSTYTNCRYYLITVSKL